MKQYTSEEIEKISNSSTEDWNEKFYKSLWHENCGLNPDNCSKMLSIFKKVITDLNIEYWLCFGTALGFYRDLEFILWDDDIDIQIDSHDMLRVGLENIKKAFMNEGFIVRSVERGLNSKMSMFYMGVKMQLQGMYEEDGMMHAKLFHYPAELYKNSQKVVYRGEEYNLPGPADDYLTFCYGPDWKTPKNIANWWDYMAPEQLKDPNWIATYNHYNSDSVANSKEENKNMKYYRKTVDGFDWILTPDDNGIGRTLLMSQSTGKNYDFSRESGFMNLIDKTIQPGMTCIDLGSNIGYATMFMLRNSGPSGFVYAIEPDDHNLKFLIENIKINGYGSKNCQVVKCLISKEDTILPFWIAKHPNLNSVNKTKHSIRQEMLRAYSLESFLKDRKYPNFIKMDIEGHEVSVFNGGFNYFKKNRGTTHILLEIHPSEYDENNNFEESLRKYFSIGFKCSNIIATPNPKPQLYKDLGLTPSRIFNSDGFTRGLYENVTNEAAIEIASKENIELMTNGRYAKKIARSIMLSRHE